MKMKKMIAMFLLVHFANIDAMSRRFMPKLPVAKYSPSLVGAQGFMPKELQTTPKGVDEQFYQWLRRQDRRIQDQIYNHDFIKDYATSMPNFKRGDSILDERVLVQREILQYVMDRPEETKDIFDFYQNMKLSEKVVEERLSYAPKAAIAKFDEIVQKYQLQQTSVTVFDEVLKARNMPIKYKILRLFKKVVVATMMGLCITSLLGYYLARYGRFTDEDIDSVFRNKTQNLQIIELCSILADAFDVDIPIVLENENHQETGSAAVVPFSAQKILILYPLFFTHNIETQIYILLHEFRHVLQSQNGFVIPADVIEYAQLCQVKKYDFSIGAFLRGLFVGGCFLNLATIEFDAEYFATNSLKDDQLLHRVEYARWAMFNPESGYWPDEMIHAKGTVPKGRYEAFDIEEAWENFLWQHSGQNIYLKYLPQGIKDAAAKNKVAKAQAKLHDLAMEQMYERANDVAGF